MPPTTRQRAKAEGIKPTEPETPATNGNQTPATNGHQTGSAKKSWNWELVNISFLPQYLQDNEFLHNSHRPPIPSLRQCIKSAFSLHTETLNIWTHALGCLGTLIAAIYFWTAPNVALAQKLWFSVFFLGAIICMGFSATYHTLLCHSEKVYKNLAKMDYVGILILCVSSFFPWLRYSFHCSAGVWLLYMVLIVCLGMLCTGVVLDDRFNQGHLKPVRAGLFIALGLTGVIPAAHYLIAHGWTEALKHLPWLIFMAFLYIAGGVIYALRIPERIIPGKFDIWGHSHQFLHICVVGGVISCYCGMSKIAGDKIGIDCGNYTQWT